MIDATVDLFSVQHSSLPPLGDTPYDLLTSSARTAANLLPSWDTSTPVVLDGDGMQTQANLASTPTVVAAVAPSLSGIFAGALQSALVGGAAIVLLGIGAFILLRGD